MIIDNSSVSSWNYATSASSSATAARRGASSSASGKPWASAGNSPAGDSVSISEAARALSQSIGLSSVPESRPGLVSLAGNIVSPAGNTGLRKYLNIGAGAGSTNLIAMNFSRQKIAGRIDNALRSAGIELKEDEKLSLSVNDKNEIVVGGIKDKTRARKIEEALNADKDLAKTMRDHVAAGKINENAAKQEAYQKYLADSGQSAPDDLDSLFTDPTLRNYVVNEYLTENAGLGLADLSLDYDEDGNKSIGGGDETLRALLTEDQQLGATIGAILESGDTSANFSVNLEYANGAITDNHSRKMADAKVSGIKDMLNKQLEAFSHKLGKTEGDDDLAALTQALSRGFTIHITKGGEIDIAGLEHMDPKYRDTLKNLLDNAMQAWADEPTTAMDGGGIRTADLTDVHDAYMQEHQFEHGDTGQYEHALEISFTGTGRTRVVSPEADKAQNAENEQIAKEMGDALREDMEKEGIDTAGLEMAVNENGKITVSGNVPAAELEKAQAFVDAFMKTARADGESGRKEEESDLAANETGEEKKPAGGSAKSDDDIDESKMSPQELRMRRIGQAWERIFPANNRESVFSLGSAGRVSDVKPGRYGNADGDDAASLYRRLLNGLGSFHDKPKSIRYAA